MGNAPHKPGANSAAPIHTRQMASTSTEEDDQHMEGIKGLVYTGIFILLLIALRYLATRAFHLFTILNEAIPNRFQLAEVGALSTLIAGLALYNLRERWRMLYALLEIAFALVTAGLAVGRVQTQGDLGVWVALAASAYLVVRGIENMKKSGFTIRTAWDQIVAGRLVTKRQVKPTDQV